MGFKFLGLSKDTCIFRVIEDGDDKQDFLQCVQRALSSSQLNIILDITGRPMALEAIFPEIRSLQQVLVNHSKSLKIKGIDDSLPPESLATLNSLKADLEFTKPEATATPNNAEQQNTEAPDVQTDVLAVQNQSDKVIGRLLDLKGRLAAVLIQKRELEMEKSFYEGRLKALGYKQEGSEHADVATEKIQRIAVLEGQLFKLADERHLLEKQVAEAEIKHKTKEEEVKAATSQIKEEYKKKREPFDKKIEEMKKKFEQTKKDFEKRAQDRKLQLATLMKSAKPSP